MYDNSIALVRSMRGAGIEYRSDTPEEDDNLIDTVRVGWKGRSLPTTTIKFRINDRGARLEASLGDVAPGKRAEALEALNAINASYRWVKLAVEEDGSVTCSSDIYMVPEVAGLFGIAGMGRMFDTLDEIYPRLAAVLSR